MKLIVFIFLFFLPVQILTCPENGIEFQSQCYVFFENSTNFLNAEFACLGMNAHLASFHDGFTNAMIASQSSNFLHSANEFWIGLNNLMISGNWSWTDNSTFNFNDWGSSEPQNIAQTCAALIMVNGFWKTDDCFQKKAYACEIVSIPSATTAAVSTTTTVSSSCFSTVTVTTRLNASKSSSYPVYMNCTDGWVYFEPTHSCYGRDGWIPLAGNGSFGEEYCKSRGGHLPSLHSYDEARFLSTLTSFNYGFLWTGLLSYDNEVSWKWSDDTPLDYLPWASGSPNRNDSSCVLLHKNAIYDYNCCNHTYIVCKKPADIANPPAPATPSYPTYVNCTEGWVYFEPTHSCYGHDGYDFLYDACPSGEQWCQSMGAHLPSLHIYDEARFLSTGAQFNGGYLWMGLTSNDNETSWKWSDGSPVDYLPWSAGYPNLNISSCVYLFANEIYDNNCTEGYSVICKKTCIF